MRLVFHLNELSGNSYFSCVTADASLEDELHSEFTANLVQWRLPVFIMHHRRPRDYPQMLRIEVPHLRNQFFGHSVAEIFLPRVAGKVLKRENGQHDAIVRRLCFSSSTRPAEVPRRDGDQKSAQRRCDNQPKSSVPGPAW